MLLKAGHRGRKRADGRAGAVKLLDSVRVSGVGGSYQARLVAAAGIHKLPCAGFQRPNKNRAEAFKVRVRLDHGIDGGKCLGRGQADGKAVGQQLAHVLGLHRLFRAMPGDITDDDGNVAFVPGGGVQQKRLVEIAARRRCGGQIGIRGGVLRRQGFLPLAQLLRFRRLRVHAPLL